MTNHPNGTSDGQIRWGILGTGFIAGLQTQDLAENGFTVQAVGSRNAESSKAFSEKFAIPTAHASYEALVADPDVDVIYIASPHTYHHAHALLALNAGKHVLVEKPFTINAREAKEIFALAEAKGLVALEAMWSRFLPHMIRLREIIQDGTLGEIRKVTASHNQDLPKDPAHRLNDPALGGGALLDLGVYPVSFAIDVLGAPETIRASASMTATGVDRQTAAIFEYAQGQQALVDCALDTAVKQPGSGYRDRGVDRHRVHLVQPHALHSVRHSGERPGEVRSAGDQPGDAVPGRRNGTPGQRRRHRGHCSSPERERGCHGRDGRDPPPDRSQVRRRREGPH